VSKQLLLWAMAGGKGQHIGVLTAVGSNQPTKQTNQLTKANQVP